MPQQSARHIERDDKYRGQQKILGPSELRQRTIQPTLETAPGHPAKKPCNCRQQLVHGFQSLPGGFPATASPDGFVRRPRLMATPNR